MIVQNKAKVLLFWLCLAPLFSYSQIRTSQNLSEKFLVQDFVLNNSYPGNVWTGNLRDEGSNSYFYRDTTDHREYWLVKIDGYWQLEEFRNGFVFLYYRTLNASSSVDPECQADWQRFTGSWYDYGSHPQETSEIVKQLCN